MTSFLVVKSAEAAKKLQFVAKTTGGCLGPFDSRLIANDIASLHSSMLFSRISLIPLYPTFLLYDADRGGRLCTMTFSTVRHFCA
jgi:hypothetical protein